MQQPINPQKTQQLRGSISGLAKSSVVKRNKGTNLCLTVHFFGISMGLRNNQILNVL